LEYVLVLVAIIIAVGVAAKGPITTALNKLFGDAQSRIESASGQLAQP